MAEDNTEFLTYSVQEIISMGTAFRPQAGAREASLQTVADALPRNMRGPLVYDASGVNRPAQPLTKDATAD